MTRAVRCLTLAALVLVAVPARAYVQTRTKSGTPVHWEQSCIFVTPDIRGDQTADGIDIPTINATLAQAAANWNDTDGQCTFLRLGVVDAYKALDPVPDGTPSLVFDSVTWPYGDNSPIIALTTVWFNVKQGDPTDGLISDADIELNAVDYTFTTSPQTAQPRNGTVGIADLQNTLTHELGHVQGLAHTCWSQDDPSEPTQPVDNTGALVPNCDDGNLPDAVVEATIYPYAASTYPADISMRTLSPDDVAGICDNYPSTGGATACYGYVQAGGCDFDSSSLSRGPSSPSRAPSSSRRPALFVMIALLWMLVRRRLA